VIPPVSSNNYDNNNATIDEANKMGLESDNNQYQLNDYQPVSKNENEWTCRVCGFGSPNKSVVENCHPVSQLDRERNTAITNPENGHVGFVFPPQMESSTKDLLEEIRAAIRQTSETTVLSAAADVIVRHLPARSDERQAFDVFTHLIWLQQYQLLPGYPVFRNVTESERVSIQEFCNAEGRFNGSVTEAQISESNLLKTNRIYRAKVLSVTQAFFDQFRHTDNGFNLMSKWDMSNPPRWAEIEFPMSVPFAQRTSHNTIVCEARNWLATHPVIDWACAPHVIGSPQVTEGETKTQSPPNREKEPSADSIYMFDFAGFTGESRSNIAVVGCVVGDEDNKELLTKLKHIRATTAVALVVVPSREDIHKLISQFDADELLATPAAPVEDTIEYYARQPNIQAVNNELTTRIPELDHIKFVTAKQLIDDIVTPVDVFSDQFRENSSVSE